MTPEEQQKYWAPVRDKIINTLALKMKRNTFSDFVTCGSPDDKGLMAEALGLPECNAGAWRHIELTDDLRRRLIMLAGPHTETVLKAIRVLNDKGPDTGSTTPTVTG